MVIHDFNIEHIAVLPFEAYAPLLVDPDAVLARAVALHKSPFEYRLRVFILEGPDYDQSLKHHDIIVKR